MTEIPLTFCIVDKVLLIIPLVVFFLFFTVNCTDFYFMLKTATFIIK